MFYLQVHPKSPIFAVAERGTSPVIILYSWPKIKPISILRYGTTHSYSCITFRSDHSDFCKELTKKLLF